MHPINLKSRDRKKRGRPEYTRQKSLYWLVAGLMFLHAASAAANPFSDMSPYDDGFAHAQKGAWENAAQTWVADGETLLKRSRGKSALQQAALFNLFATIAFENANNARAYVTWSATVRYFLEGGTSWEKQREVLRVKVHAIDASLKANITGPNTIGGTDPHRQLVEMAETLHLTTYTGPAQNLKVQTVSDDEPEIHVTRNYFPRPQALVTQESAAPVQKKGARHGATPPESTQPVEGTRQPGAPMIPVSQSASPPPLRTAPIQEERIAIPPVPSLKAAHTSTVAPRPVPTRTQARDTGDFTAEDLEIAQTAWRYFTENYQANTGLVNSVHNYPYATLWDVGSNLAAFLCALKLDLIPPTEGEEKITRLLETLLVVELYNGELPNREYNTKTGEMTDLSSRPSALGSGWSALDIGRLLIWMKIAESWYPNFEPLVKKVAERWSFTRLVQYRELNGVLHDGRKEWLRQEGRLGYEQYAAMGPKLFGFDVRQALDYKETQKTTVLGHKILYDTRNKAYLTSDPFLMAKMELGEINETFTSLTHAFYAIQQRRWEQDETITAVNEDALDKEPWFIYNTLFYEGDPWMCVTHDGNPAPMFASISTKAALGWSVLYDDAYAGVLRRVTVGLSHPRHGFYAGLYTNGEINKSKNINTNAVILEAMLYRKRGASPFFIATP